MRNAAGSYDASNGMGADCCGMLQRLIDGQESWYACARDRLSVEHCAQSLPIDKPGLSFCCGSGTDKRRRLCVAEPALIDQRCLSPLAFGAGFPLYGHVL
jgi:hypothetical protein